MISVWFALDWCSDGFFEAYRGTLRIEGGGKISSLRGCALQGVAIFGIVGNTPNQNILILAFKFIVDDNHHMVNELWPPLDLAYKLQILKSEFFKYVYTKYV